MSAFDPISLCNVALIRIGENPISSFNDGTANSIACNTCFPQSRQWLLSTYPWAFANTWTELAQITTSVIPGQHYKYQYQLPVGWLRINSVWFGGSNTPSASVIGGQPNPYVAELSSTPSVIQFNQVSVDWQIGPENTLLSNDPFLGLWYNIDIPDTLQWSAYFGECLLAHLAWQLSFARTKSSAMQQSMEAAYVRISATARHSDSIGQPSQNIGVPGQSNLLGIRRY